MIEPRCAAWGLLLLAPLLAGVTCGVNNVDVEEKTLTVAMDGSQVVPPVETPAVGNATARLFGNGVTLQGTFSDLTSAVLPEDEGAVAFRLGEPGENGPVIASSSGASVDGRTGSFQIDVLLDDELVDIFLAGGTYVEIRSADHPEGELRAQLK